MRIHLDTDLGGDPDDACALAMLLGWPGVELVGIRHQHGCRATAQPPSISYRYLSGDPHAFQPSG